MSAGKGARPGGSHAEALRCCCYLLPHSGAYCMRAGSLKEYMQANLDVSKESRVTLYEKAEATVDAASVKEGNFVLKSCDRDSTVGEAVEVAGRTVIKKSSIGPLLTRTSPRATACFQDSKSIRSPTRTYMRISPRNGCQASRKGKFGRSVPAAGGRMKPQFMSPYQTSVFQRCVLPISRKSTSPSTVSNAAVELRASEPP